MTKASDNAFPSLLITEGTEPSAPAAGKQRLYIDSTTHLLMLTNSAGTESAVGGVLGAWTTYVPVLTATTTNPTLGSSTLVGAYKLLDSKTLIVHIHLTITTGGAWNAGSGNWQFSLPTGNAKNTSGYDQLGSAHVLDSGTTHYAGVAKISANETKFSEIIIADAGNPKILANNNPITWATGDKVNIQATIQLE